MQKTNISPWKHQTHRLGVALTASLITHSLLLAWVAPFPPPPVYTPLMVRLTEEPRSVNAPAAVHHRATHQADRPAVVSTPAPSRLPMSEIARAILRADAESQRRLQQERSTLNMAPSVMFDNLKDERFTPATPTASPAGVDAYATIGGLLVYRRVGRDGKISCTYVRPADPNNEYDHGAIYLWSLDFDAKHAKRGGC